MRRTKRRRGPERKKKPPKQSGGDIEYTPPAEALINTPLPIYVKVGADIGAISAKLRYKPFGETKWLSVKMKTLKTGFAGVVPCSQVTTTGKLRFYVIFKDKGGDPVATVGRLKAPLEITIKNKIDGKQPALPGEKPPKKCTSVECPPDFPGCKSGPSKVGWGGSCEESKQCRDGLKCVNGSCEKGSGDDDDDDDDDATSSAKGGKLPKNLITIGAQIDDFEA